MEQNLKNLQKTEAIKRLKILQKQYGLMHTILDAFERKDIVYYSQYIPETHQGILYKVSDREDYANLVKAFEEEKKALVYHIIVKPSIRGTELKLLYISMHQNKWEEDKIELRITAPVTYIVNVDNKSKPVRTRIQIMGAGGGITTVL